MRFAAAIALLLAFATPAPARDLDVAGDFDFYVLALSWTPSYCATASRPDPDECDTGRTFSVHGFWPQYDRGEPESCAGDNPPWINRSTLESISDLMPDRGLVIHEWRKHGVCAGLRPEAYFDLLRQAFEKVRIPLSLTAGHGEVMLGPNEIENAFILANPGLPARSIAVECDHGRFTEVRVCFEKNLAWRRCPAVDGSACRTSLIKVPPAK